MVLSGLAGLASPPLLDLLASFYAAVEAAGRWPACFNLALVAMLHKGGSDELDDFRPIVLLSTIYRLWASLRSRVMRSWLLMNGLLPASSCRGADSQAYELSLRLALARLAGVTVSGLAIDWSKCYDRLPLQVLKDLSLHLGLPAGLWMPMLDMYSRPRAILLQGGIGQAQAPSHGLCAVDWLTLVMSMLTRATSNIAPTVQSRPYVDDITSDISTLDVAEAVEAVTEMDRVARAFGGAFGLVLHERKSKRFSTCKTVRSALGRLPGPKVVVDFVDLGVLQSVSNIRTTAESVRRAELALVKLSRISLVALPFHQRCLLTSASGVPTAMFGMAAQPLSNVVVLGLRTTAFGAIWRSGKRSAQEIVCRAPCAEQNRPPCRQCCRALAFLTWLPGWWSNLRLGVRPPHAREQGCGRAGGGSPWVLASGRLHSAHGTPDPRLLWPNHGGAGTCVPRAWLSS